MNLKKLFFVGLAAFGFASCNSFLDVEAPSKYDNDYVFNKKSEITRALNGVYAQLLSNSTYGNAYLSTFVLNSDVEMWTSGSEVATDTGYRRFDCTPLGSNINSYWNAAYMGVEYANNFIYHLEQSPLYQAGDEELDQMMGEAKVLRAIFYHDLVVMFGDIPFSLEPVSDADNDQSLLLPVTDREEVHKALIADLEQIAPKMQFAADLSNGVERASKEMAWAMIARMALTCGGYSLRPDTSNAASYGTMQRPANYREYYQLAATYAGYVIESGMHALNKAYNKVFIDECNYVVTNNDDPIFEIPFAQKSSGNVGYLHGPSGSLYEGRSTGHAWGGSNGGALLSAFYRFFFDEGDLRRDYVNGFWDYLYDGTPNIRINNQLTIRNNKWSKFWGPALGADTEGSTGINYPYMRYADVLLMYAEAENELNGGPTPEAVEALRQVRMRAFGGDAATVESYLAAIGGSKEEFLKALLDERKLEFAGENMRWRDLVRNNLYSEVLYYAFMRYYGMADPSSADIREMVSLYDGKDEEFWDNVPETVYYKPDMPNYTDGNIDVYPNTTLNMIEFYPNSLYKKEVNTGQYAGYSSAYPFTGSSWWDDGEGYPSTSVLYSFYGFMRGDTRGNIYVVRNGQLESPDLNNLPPVRYILPYPNNAIQRSGGVYKNYYGY